MIMDINFGKKYYVASGNTQRGSILIVIPVRLWSQSTRAIVSELSEVIFSNFPTLVKIGSNVINYRDELLDTFEEALKKFIYEMSLKDNKSVVKLLFK